MKNIMVLCIATLLCGCSTVQRLDITSRPIEIPITQVPDPTGIQMLPVTFHVVTGDSVTLFVQDLTKTKGPNPVFVAITLEDYQNMGTNMADIRRYIEQLQGVVKYYRDITQPITQQNLPSLPPQPISQ